MKTVFDKSDFALCEVYVPKGYPQSQTHAGVFLHNSQIILSTSPYPSAFDCKLKAYFKAGIRKLSLNVIGTPQPAEFYENPLLYVGDCDCSHGIPIRFKLVQERPLMESPDPVFGFPAFNSDPDVFCEEEWVYILNRVVYRTGICPGEILNKYFVRVFLLKGRIEKQKFLLYSNELLIETDELFVSPCLCKHNNQYLLFHLDTASLLDGMTFGGLYYSASSTIEGLKTISHQESITVDCGEYLPWHLSVFEYCGELYAIVACVKKGVKARCWQMLGKFNSELSLLKIYQEPLTCYRSYRGAALVTPNGEFVLYNTTVNEKVVGGKSIDGREVIMAHRSFNKVLEELESYGE